MSRHSRSPQRGLNRGALLALDAIPSSGSMSIRVRLHLLPAFSAILRRECRWSCCLCVDGVVVVVCHVPGEVLGVHVAAFGTGVLVAGFVVAFVVVEGAERVAFVITRAAGVTVAERFIFIVVIADRPSTAFCLHQRRLPFAHISTETTVTLLRDRLPSGDSLVDLAQMFVLRPCIFLVLRRTVVRSRTTRTLVLRRVCASNAGSHRRRGAHQLSR